MPTYVGVLRAINLGSHNRIAMSDLRAMLERVGCEEPRTLLLSGNVVFRNASSSIEKVERMLEEASTKHLGVTTVSERSEERSRPPVDDVPARHAVTRARQGYFFYPGGIGNSKLTIKVIETALGTRGTARNWNTVLKIGELVK